MQIRVIEAFFGYFSNIPNWLSFQFWQGQLSRVALVWNLSHKWWSENFWTLNEYWSWIYQLIVQTIISHQKISTAYRKSEHEKYLIDCEHNPIFSVGKCVLFCQEPHDNQTMLENIQVLAKKRYFDPCLSLSGFGMQK